MPSMAPAGGAAPEDGLVRPDGLTWADEFRLACAVAIIALVCAAATWFDPRLAAGYVPTTGGPTVIDIVVLPMSLVAVVASWFDRPRRSS